MGKRKTKKGKTARNAQSGLGNTEPEEIVKAPHSFVINRGKLGKNAFELMRNFRKIMEPFTAAQLKVQKQNVIKDFVHMAGPLNVTHLIVFTKTEKAMYLRVAKLPRGPTLTYQIKEYSLIKDVISSQKRSHMYEKLFEHHPLLVLNNFTGEGMHFKLMATMFQNMFPSINVNKTNLNTIRRCLLLNYNNDDKTIDMRQYAIKVIPAGVSKAVKKLIQSKVPNLSKYQDVDEFLQKAGNLSESEYELDGEANTVTLPQPISSRGNITSEKSAIRLFEIGPRISLQLIKIEEGLMSGEIMFHEYITRSPEEIKALKERIKAKKALKEKRKAEQQRNVERKKREKAGKTEEEEESKDESDDDREWYRKEVGEEPDENILPGLKRKRSSDKQTPFKKRKLPEGKSLKVKNFKADKSSNHKEDTQTSSEKGKTMQEFLKRRKKRKEAKLSKKKSKKISQRVLTMRAKQSTSKKFTKKNVK